MAGGAQAREIPVLKIADAAVDHLEALCGSCAAEVSALDERRAQSSQGGVARRRRAECASADHQDVVLAINQQSRPSLHRTDRTSVAYTWHSRCMINAQDGAGCVLVGDKVKYRVDSAIVSRPEAVSPNARRDLDYGHMS